VTAQTAQTNSITALAPRSTPLYELASDYVRVLDLLDDPDADPAALEAELDQIAGKITHKATDAPRPTSHSGRGADKPTFTPPHHQKGSFDLS
jgi:hypothetical protein